ncbi:TolC family protein [Dyella koreensis]|uniref:TolC family protein n=1 Tax=Dyella koreensis TaxID=311235 RepID=A0ABW8K1L2_9GAMM
MAIAFLGLALPAISDATPAADAAPKKYASWRDEFDVIHFGSSRATKASSPAQPAATLAKAVATPDDDTPSPVATVERVAAASTVTAAPKAGTPTTGIIPSRPVASWATSASPTPGKPAAPVTALPEPLPVTLRETNIARIAPVHTSNLASAPSTTTPQTVSAAVFSQWLDDQPVDEAARRNASGITDAQLRQRFHDAIRIAAERSPNVTQALAQWEATRYDVDNARGQRLPQVKLSGQSPTRTFGGPMPASSPSLGASVSVNVTTPVFDWGTGRKAVQSTRHLADAAEQGYQATLGATALDVSQTLLELGRYRSMTTIGDAYVKRMRSLVDMLAQISAADQGRRSEWVQAKAQLLQAMANRDASAAQVRQLEIKMSILLGDHPVELPGDGIWPIQLADANRLLADFQDHPAIRQAKATAEAADTSADAQRASKRPRLDWVVSKTAFRDAQGPQQPWATSLQLSWPLFSGGSDRAAYRAALARVDANRQQVDVLKRNYEYQVRDAAQTAVDAFARAEAYADLSNETLLVRKAMFEQWYQLGKRSLLDVLTSETDHYNDMIGEVSNRFDAYEAVFSAYDGAGKLVDWLGIAR